MRNEKSPKRDLLSKNTDGMTKRSDGVDGGAGAPKEERVVQSGSGETRDVRTGSEAVRRKREEPSGRNSPTRRRRIDDEGRRRKKRGRIGRAKGIPQSALWGSVNATLKSAYKSLRRRFPSARGVPIGLKLVRPTCLSFRPASSSWFSSSSLCLGSTYF